MYIADSINSKEVSFSSELSEQLQVKVELLNNSDLLVGTIYRSPSINPNDSIAELYYTLKQVLETRPPYLLVAGDFNLPGIDWSSEKFSGNSCEQEFMIQQKKVCCFNMFLSQLMLGQVQLPTYQIQYLLMK